MSSTPCTCVAKFDTGSIVEVPYKKVLFASRSRTLMLKGPDIKFSNFAKVISAITLKTIYSNWMQFDWAKHGLFLQQKDALSIDSKHMLFSSIYAWYIQKVLVKCRQKVTNKLFVTGCSKLALSYYHLVDDMWELCSCLHVTCSFVLQKAGLISQFMCSYRGHTRYLIWRSCT